MGRSVRQKRKNRSSRPVVRPNNNRKRPANPTGNQIVAANWNKDQTLTQNYRRLGLMNRLRLPSGGVEKFERDPDSLKQKRAVAGGNGGGILSDPFHLKGFSNGHKTVREVRVERDADGKIVRVVQDSSTTGRPTTGPFRPLDDLLNDVEEAADEDEDDEMADDGEVWGGIEDDESSSKKNKKTKKTQSTASTPVVQALEALAAQPDGPRRQRYQSSGEQTWLQTLVDHYGTTEPDEEVLGRMVRDRRRNPMQHTAGELSRRLRKFRQAGGEVSALKK